MIKGGLEIMTLREARVLFTKFVALLIQKAFELGYEPALDEGMDRLTIKDPTTDHMAGSLHGIGLAQDLILYKDGVWQNQSEQYRPLGDYWKSLHLFCHWGGDFPGDGNHFSFSDESIPGCTTSTGRLRK